MASYAPAQLSESDEAAEQRWESLDEAELNTEIDAYKTSLRTIRNSVHGLGISPGWEPDHDHLAPLREGNDGNGAGWARLMTCTLANGKFPLIVSPYMPTSPRMTGGPLHKPPSSMS